MNRMYNEDYINDLYASGIIKDKAKQIHLRRIENYKISVQQYYQNMIKLQEKKSEISNKNAREENQNNHTTLLNNKCNESENDIINNVLQSNN